MLVIIAIIAVMLAMFMPTLSSIKEYAGMVMCAKNMSNLAIASRTYCRENDDKIAGPNWGRNEPATGSPDNGWLTGRGATLEDPTNVRTGLFWQYINTYEGYRCATDQFNPNDLPWPGRNSRLLTSYCMNGSVCAYGSRIWHAGTRRWNTYRWSEFDSNDIILWETDETRISNLGWWWDGASFPWEGITQRHIDKGNTVCADGHAEWMLLEEYDRLDAERSKNRLWNTPKTKKGKYVEN